MTKAHPERVIPALAQKALEETDQRAALYTHYIILHYRATGNLAPGCDARDLYAWLEEEHRRIWGSDSRVFDSYVSGPG